jgi:hypothetical protein
MAFDILEVRLGALRLPMTPSQIMPDYEAVFLEHRILALGRVREPRGREPWALGWKGVLPGYERQFLGDFVFEWQDPRIIIAQIVDWLTLGTKVRCQVSQTEIDWDVYVAKFSPEVSGGYGDREYTITLVEAREFDVGIESSGGRLRTTVETPRQYTTRSGDSWLTAAAAAGIGAPQWQALWKANPGVTVDGDGFLSAGVTLTVPRVL